MRTDALTSNQAYEVSKERSYLRNNTRRDDAPLEESTATHHAAKAEGGLALVKKANMALEAISTPVEMAKLNVDYLEELIHSKVQIP